MVKSDNLSKMVQSDGIHFSEGGYCYKIALMGHDLQLPVNYVKSKLVSHEISKLSVIWRNIPTKFLLEDFGI